MPPVIVIAAFISTTISATSCTDSTSPNTSTTPASTPTAPTSTTAAADTSAVLGGVWTIVPLFFGVEVIRDNVHLAVVSCDRPRHSRRSHLTRSISDDCIALLLLHLLRRSHSTTTPRLTLNSGAHTRDGAVVADGHRVNAVCSSCIHSSTSASGISRGGGTAVPQHLRRWCRRLAASLLRAGRPPLAVCSDSLSRSTHRHAAINMQRGVVTADTIHQREAIDNDFGPAAGAHNTVCNNSC
jgi:hypothetical protein